MKKNLLVFLCLHSLMGLAQLNYSCSNMAPICPNPGLTFTAYATGIPASTADPGNDYGCLFTTPNPTWYYLKIESDGNLDMDITANADIDFIIWGPFSDLLSAALNCGNLGNGGTGGQIVDCSYSVTAAETPHIGGANAGEVYVLLITNYSSVIQDISLTQWPLVGGSATASCDILTDSCIANVGTHSYTKNGSPTSPPIVLCEGDSFSITSDLNYTLPADTIPQPTGDGTYSAQMMYMVYDCPPITGNPATDPCFLNYMIPSENISDIHDASSDIISLFGCGEYWFVPVVGDDGVGGNNNIANGVNDNGALHWDRNGNGCFELGQAIAVNYVCDLNYNLAINCSYPGLVNGFDLQMSGGTGNYTIYNNGPGYLTDNFISGFETTTIKFLENGWVYDLYAIDETGCGNQITGTFAAPVINNITIISASDCPGTDDGQVDVQVLFSSGHGAPFKIKMGTNPVVTSTTASINGYAGGIVPIVVYDSENCQTDTSVTITSSGHFIDLQLTAVQGVDCIGNSDGSATIQVTPDAGYSIVNIEWTDPFSNSLTGSGNFTTLTNMLAGIWQVCATDDYGLGCEVCIPVEIMSQDCYAATESYQSETVFVYPNPSEGQISIDWNQEGKLILMDLEGRLVSQAEVNSGLNHLYFELDDGVYIYQLVSELNKIVKTGKLVFLH